MSSELNTALELDIGHILFIDIVGYSQLRINQQHETLHKLSEVVRNTNAFLTAETAGTLLRLSTGSGIVLAFAATPDAPVRCAMQISKALRSYPELKVRMGVHSGPLNRTTGVNDSVKVAGAGLNIAQEVMDCGNIGHILLSKQVAEQLAEDWHWQPFLHDLGQREVRGDIVSVVNLYTDEVGNPSQPEKFRRKTATQRSVNSTVRLNPVPAQNTLLAILFFSALAVAIGYWIFFPPVASNSSNKPTGPEIQILTAATKDKNHDDGNRATPSRRTALLHP